MNTSDNLVKSPCNLPIIRKWICEHQESSKYISFSFKNENEKSSKSFEQQKAKYLHQLDDNKKRIILMKEQSIANLTKIAEAPFVKLGELCFDNQSDNSDLRKLVFLHHKIQKTNLKLNNLILNVYLGKIDDFDNLRQIIRDIPDTVTCKIADDFFMVNLSKKIQTLSYHLISLENYLNNLNKATVEKPRPRWYTDFVGFMHDELKKAVPHIDAELSYIPQLPFELQVSRYCFSVKSKVGERIDSMIQTIFETPPIDFLKLVLDNSLTLLPEAETFTQEEQTVALLVFFRIIFDRLYELYPDFMFPSDGKECVKMSELASLPCSVFNLPKDSSPQHTEDEMIREAFRKDCYYRSAAQFLENTTYSTNPIDCLFFIHKTLLCINKAALMNRMKEKEASVNDLQQLLCFDDLFILFLGVYLSSDTYEFLSVADFVARFSPAFCLSNSFEYAQASLESLVKHLQTLDPKKLRNEGKEQ